MTARTFWPTSYRTFTNAPTRRGSDVITTFVPCCGGLTRLRCPRTTETEAQTYRRTCRRCGATWFVCRRRVRDGVVTLGRMKWTSPCHRLTWTARDRDRWDRKGGRR
jgi:hypothetical protein